MKIIARYDNGGKTADRYTAVFDLKQGRYNVCLSMSDSPTSPQGFSQWSECDNVRGLMGKSVDRFPDHIEAHIQDRLNSGI